MDQITFIQDMAVVMTISAAILLICRQLRLPVVLGYILAGVLVGPHTPPSPLVKDLHSIHILSELGVIFLLFSIGLEFSLVRLARVGAVAFIAATFEILVMIGIGYAIGQAFGWNAMDSLFLGAILSISSTTIIAKVLFDMKKIKEQFAQVIIGILIIEDLLAIVIIAILSGIASTGSLEIAQAGIAAFRVMSFIAGVVLFGFLIVPPLIRYVAKFESDEMLIITVLGLCLGVSLIAAQSGFSVALGAFLIGAVLAETKEHKAIIHKMAPIRDMFTAIFFVSVGMLLSPAIVAEYWLPILVLTAVTIVGKLVSCSLATFATGYSSETSLKVGLGLAQIGEFSFIIARLGESSGVTSAFLYPVAVSVSCVTTLTTPLLMRNTMPIIGLLDRLTPSKLATVLGLYPGWLRKIGESRSKRRTSVFWKGLRYYLPRLGAYAVVAGAFFFGVASIQSNYRLMSPEVYRIVLGLAMFPLFIGLAYLVDHMLWRVFFSNLTRGAHSKEIDAIFKNAIRFLVTLVFGFGLYAVGSIFLPRAVVGMAVLGFVAATGFYLWGSIGSVHEKIEKTLLSVFDQEKPSQTRDTHRELMRLIGEEYPWAVKTEDYLLPFTECGVNQSIRDLRLRSETGSTIVSIYRGDEIIANPPSETRLLPGDVLLLMGDEEQVKAGLQFLQKKVKEPAPAAVDPATAKTLSFEVKADCPFLGRTLGDIKLRRKTGVTLLGIQKEGFLFNNPNADTVFEEGDKLALFGFPHQLDAAVRYLSS